MNGSGYPSPTETEAIRRLDRKCHRVGVMREEQNKKLDPKSPMERLLEAVEREEALQRAQAVFDILARTATENGYKVTKIELRKGQEKYWANPSGKLERRK